MTQDPEVEPGQVWIDNDPRSEGRRTLRVLRIEGDRVICLTLTDWHGAKDGSKETRIALRRFKPTSTGYRLADEVSR